MRRRDGSRVGPGMLQCRGVDLRLLDHLPGGRRRRGYRSRTRLDRFVLRPPGNLARGMAYDSFIRAGSRAPQNLRDLILPAG